MSTSTRTLVLLSGLAAVGTLSTTIILPSFPAMAFTLGSSQLVALAGCSCRKYSPLSICI